MTMIGKRYGKLTVEEFSHTGNYNHKHWKCRCDCGNMTIGATRSLQSGSKVSCGCRAKSTGKDSFAWKGYQEIGSSFWTKIQKEASNRHLVFEITIEFAWELFLAQ